MPFIQKLHFFSKSFPFHSYFCVTPTSVLSFSRWQLSSIFIALFLKVSIYYLHWISQWAVCHWEQQQLSRICQSQSFHGARRSSLFLVSADISSHLPSINTHTHTYDINYIFKHHVCINGRSALKLYLIILLNIMYHAPMGRFQLQLIYYFTYFSTVVPCNICVFLSCRPFVVNTFSTGLVGAEVASVPWLGLLTVGV